MLPESLVKADETDESMCVEETRNRYGILFRKLHENGSVIIILKWMLGKSLLFRCE
jgi:hypothetical protein